MFDSLYVDASAVARHKAGPLAEERIAFLTELSVQGYKPQTLRWLESELLLVAQQLPVSRDRQISLAQIDELTSRWPLRTDGRSGKTPDESRKFFRSTAVSFFRYLNRLKELSEPPVPFLSQVLDYGACLQKERGLAKSTIERTCKSVEDFLSWFVQRNESFSQIGIEDIDAYFALKSAQGLQRLSLRTIANHLRGFFRHAEQKGWLHDHLADSILGPRIYVLEHLPQGPSWEQVQQLIATTAGNRPIDIRDRAILLLFATYGLRSGDVSGLRLEDLDWENEILRIIHPKRRQAEQYPLVQEVGDAIIRYLKEVRPRSPNREVFLTLHAPIHRLSQGTLWNVVGERIRKLQTSLPHRGPHSLRHACATHLLADGLSLQHVSEQLGHASLNVTRIYGKVDLPGLRAVAAVDLGGLL